MGTGEANKSVQRWRPTDQDLDRRLGRRRHRRCPYCVPLAALAQFRLVAELPFDELLLIPPGEFPITGEK